ncbi:MAG: hypothetical protein AAGE43_20720 [Pseudomonadota bacterium]
MDSQTDGKEPTISHEEQDGLLRVVVAGPATLAFVTAYATRFQDVWSRYQRILWDLRGADPTVLSSEDILNVNHAFGEIMDLRAGGRTALLISKDVELIAKIAIALCEGRDAPVTLRAFLDEPEALVWVQEP